MINFKTINITTEVPIRLDRYIRKYFNNMTQGMIEKALRQGQIKLNNLKARASDRVDANDDITYNASIFIPKKYDNDLIFSPSVIRLANKLISEYLIFSSEEFIAVNKPTGLAVQGGSKINLSINNALDYLNYTTNLNYKIVHRLDKDTSGILLIAKNHLSAIKLSDAFKQHLIHKIYIAIVSGKPPQKLGIISNYIGKNRSSTFESVQEMGGTQGKKAYTEYKLLEYKNGRSIIEFKPKTGRMHQLRFHAKYLGCPIVGDKKYFGVDHTRMLLHAQEIIIDPKIFGKKIAITSKTKFDL